VTTTSFWDPQVLQGGLRIVWHQYAKSSDRRMKAGAFCAHRGDALAKNAVPARWRKNRESVTLCASLRNKGASDVFPAPAHRTEPSARRATRISLLSLLQQPRRTSTHTHHVCHLLGLWHMPLRVDHHEARDRTANRV